MASTGVRGIPRFLQPCGSCLDADAEGWASLGFLGGGVTEGGLSWCRHKQWTQGPSGGEAMPASSHHTHCPAVAGLASAAGRGRRGSVLPGQGHCRVARQGPRRQPEGEGHSDGQKGRGLPGSWAGLCSEPGGRRRGRWKEPARAAQSPPDPPGTWGGSGPELPVGPPGGMGW